jgi:hypothetical protein
MGELGNSRIVSSAGREVGASYMDVRKDERNI